MILSHISSNVDFNWTQHLDTLYLNGWSPTGGPKCILSHEKLYIYKSDGKMTYMQFWNLWICQQDMFTLVKRIKHCKSMHWCLYIRIFLFQIFTSAANLSIYLITELSIVQGLASLVFLRMDTLASNIDLVWKRFGDFLSFLACQTRRMM